MARTDFAAAFDRVIGRLGVAWNLTFGLYWARPWSFVSLDQVSQVYVNQKLGITIGRNGPKKRCNASDFLAVMDVLEPRFREPSYPVHSYPELSLKAWLFNDPGREAPSKEIESVGEKRRRGNFRCSIVSRCVTRDSTDRAVYRC